MPETLVLAELSIAQRQALTVDEWHSLLGRNPTQLEWKPRLPNSEIPPEWKKQVPPDFLEMAMVDGHIIPTWTFEDYILYSAMFGKYEMVAIWGIQGNGKSNLLLQILYWIYHNWDTVLEFIEFKPRGLVDRFKKIKPGIRIPGLGYDDVTVHNPSSKFKTDIETYEAMDQLFAAIRTMLSVMVCTTPIIDRLPKNMKDNITFEITVGRNQNLRIYRIFRMPGLTSMESNLFKVQIEQGRTLNIYDVPLEPFQKYEDKRFLLAGEAVNILDKTSEHDMVPDGYVDIFEAGKICDYNPAYVGQLFSRSYVEGVKIGKKIYVCLDQVKQIRGSKRGRV